MLLQLRFGDTEFRFEGSGEEFNDFGVQVQAAFFDRIGTIAKGHASPPREATVKKQQLDLSMRGIASQLRVSSGAELTLAAAFYLAEVKGEESFGREAVLSAAKEATGYYKASVRSNLSNYIDRNVRAGKLLENSSGKFSLSADAHGEMAGKVVAS